MRTYNHTERGVRTKGPVLTARVFRRFAAAAFKELSDTREKHRTRRQLGNRGWGDRTPDSPRTRCARRIQRLMRASFSAGA
jgi:hypothetical protein